MELAVIILSYLLWIGDLVDGFLKKEDNNMMFTAALITLVSWKASTPWGISMLCFSGLLLIIFIMGKAKRNKGK